MRNLFFLLLTGFAMVSSTTPIFSQDKNVASDIPDYIRFRPSLDKSGPDFLETAVSRFQKDHHTVDLIAVVHLGDAEYYRMLTHSLKPYDAVFYEMVGGPYSEEKARQNREATVDSELGQVKALQETAKKLLGLEFQLDGLDYLAGNFVHADMTAEEFLQHSQNGQDLSNLLARALKMAQTGSIKGMPSTEAEANQLTGLLFGAMMTGNSNALKRALAPILGEAEGFISSLEEDEESVLITKRNDIVIDRIEETLALNPGARRTDAVLYGAGHMPGLEIRLKELGYEKVSTQWSQSWKIDQGRPKTAAQTPNLKDLTKQFGDLLDSTAGPEAE